jgi:TonB family protein
MHVRPDGTVRRVEVIRSTGYRVLDQAVIRALIQWRFRPGLYKIVTTPVTFAANLPEPKT